MQGEITHSNVAHDMVDYEPLIDELDIWQGIFELALDEAAKHLDPQQFPVRDLQASLEEMCELLRVVLMNSIPRTEM